MNTITAAAHPFPRNTDGKHCRRFFTTLAWDLAEMRAGNVTILRGLTPRHRAEVIA